jgi:hypothetical protein
MREEQKALYQHKGVHELQIEYHGEVDCIEA